MKSLIKKSLLTKTPLMAALGILLLASVSACAQPRGFMRGGFGFGPRYCPPPVFAPAPRVFAPAPPVFYAPAPRFTPRRFGGGGGWGWRRGGRWGC